MAAPTQERPKVLIPLPPLPEFYQKKREGGTKTASSSTSSDSPAKKTTKSHKSGKKAVAGVEVKTETKVEVNPPGGPNLPPVKPSSNAVTSHQLPTKADIHSFPSAKLPPLPPPPPGLEVVDKDDMTYRYSHHYRHVHQIPVHDAKPTKDSQSRGARIITIPPPPPGFPGFQAEPKPVAQATLTIYHICRICLRPRSEKYHLEHPIPVDGVPPPPGICRRCRITSVEERGDHTKLVHIEESDKVKLGVSAFLPKESLYTREEASKAIRKQHQKGYAERFIRENSSDEDEHEQVIYRYVKRTKNVAPDSPPIQRAEVSFENLAAMNLMNDQSSPRLETKRTTQQANVTSESDAGPAQYTAQYVRLAEVQKIDSSKSSSSTSSSKPGKKTTTQKPESTKASVSVKTSVAGSQSNVKATAQVNAPAPPGFTESEIRIFARDEVERYRQAERMMHAHPTAYAHGRMVPVVPEVPVERRIEAVKDQATPKPWNVPLSSPKEPIFAAYRSKATSTESKAGSGYSDRPPTEESRHRYYAAEIDISRPNSISGTRSTSSKDNASLANQQSAKGTSARGGSERYEHDVEVVVERDRVPRSSQRLPESDPPASVKLKEVVGMIREEPISAAKSTASSNRRYDPDVIEVTEEIELPPGYKLKPASVLSADPVISQRVKVLRSEPIRHQQQRKGSDRHQDRDLGSGREASLRTDKSYWENDAVVRTASGHSGPKVRTEVRVKSRERSPRKHQDTADEQNEVAMPSPSQFLPTLSSHGQSDDDSWYASRVKSVAKHQPPPEHVSAGSKRQDDDDDKTVWPVDDAPVRPAASERASLREDWDWEYRKRVVKATDHRAPGVEYANVEREFRRLRPAQSSKGPRDIERQPSAYSSHARDRQASAAPSNAGISIRSRTERKPPPQDRGRGPYMHNSEESAHVRFASKVEFSPTPPGSDESLPERILRIKPSSHHSSGMQPGRKSALRNQIDGGTSEPPESAEDLVSVYESGRSMRGRSVERGEDLDYVSAKCASSARGSGISGSRAADSARSDPRSHRSQTSRASALRVGEDGDPQDVPLDEYERRVGRSARRSDTGTGRGSSPGGTETATQLSTSRRLARARSESPSREKMHQEFLRAQREQQRQQEREGPKSTASSRGRQEWHEPESDGKGPYREEGRTESMDALYGSGHGGPKGRQHEYVVRERW